MASVIIAALKIVSGFDLLLPVWAVLLLLGVPVGGVL